MSAAGACCSAFWAHSRNFLGPARVGQFPPFPTLSSEPFLSGCTQPSTHRHQLGGQARRLWEEPDQWSHSLAGDVLDQLGRAQRFHSIRGQRGRTAIWGSVVSLGAHSWHTNPADCRVRGVQPARVFTLRGGYHPCCALSKALRHPVG